MAEQKKPSQKAVVARAEAAKAKSAATQATADAMRAQAAAETRRADVEMAKINAQTSERADKERKLTESKSVGEQIRQGALGVAGPAAGIYVGHKLANRISARHEVTMGRRAEATKALAKMTTGKSTLGATGRERLKAVVSTADKMKLGKTRGPLGGITAGILLAEGLYSRTVLADSVENESAKETFRTIGNASAFAATSLVGERLIANATPKVLPNAADSAKIEVARNLSNMPTPLRATATKISGPKVELAKQKAPAAKATTRIAAPKAAKAVRPAVAKPKATKATPLSISKPVGAADVKVPKVSVRMSAARAVTSAPMSAAPKVFSARSLVTSRALSVGGVAAAGLMAFSAGSSSARAAGRSSGMQTASGAGAAAATVAVGGGVAIGTTKAVSFTAKKLAASPAVQSLAAKATGRLAVGLAVRIGTKAIPVVGTALLVKDVFTAARDAYRGYQAARAGERRGEAAGGLNRLRALNTAYSGGTRRVDADGKVNAYWRTSQSGKRSLVQGYSR